VKRVARFWSTTPAFFASFLASLAATAEQRTPTTARLEWRRAEGTESCIDGASLAEAVDRRWGRKVFVDDPSASVLVKGVVDRPRGAWRVHLELERADGSKLGSRDIVTGAPDCSSLDDSVALALGLMLDLTERPPETEESRAVNAPPASGPPITIPEETAAARVPWRFEPALGGEAAVGLLPGLTLGARVAMAIEPPRLWRIEVGGTLWQKQDAETGPMGAHLSMWTLDVAICPLSVEDEKLNAWACLAQRAGTVRATGVGFDRNVAQNDTFLGAEARLGATWAFASPFVVHAAFGLVAPLVRLAFVYRDEQGDTAALYRMPPVAGTLGVGIGARF
jgi:hypothetical protein